MKKYILTGVVAVALIVAAFLIYTNKEYQPDSPPDSPLIENLKKISGVNLAYKGEVDFDWYARSETGADKIKVPGVLYSAGDVRRADYEKIEKYMTGNFVMDNYNVADGVMGGLRGYRTNEGLCALEFRHNEIKNYPNAPSEPVGDSLKVTLSCGNLTR